MRGNREHSGVPKRCRNGLGTRVGEGRVGRTPAARDGGGKEWKLTKEVKCRFFLIRRFSDRRIEKREKCENSV